MTVRPHPARLLKTVTAGPFDYPTTKAGVSADSMTTVYYDPSLGQSGADLAAALLAAAPKLNDQCMSWFGIPIQPVNLIVANLGGDGSGDGGAYHYGCSFVDGGDLYVDAANGNPQMDIGLYIAELSECFQGAAGKGWNCGGSGGEALSRLHAELVSGGSSGALTAFTSAPSWDQTGRPDWISADQGSDQDYPSIGCGMVYLSWMMAQGFSAAQITQVGEPAGTLESNYVALTGKSGAFASMTAALTTSSIQVTSDDPFGGIASNPGGAQRPPSPPPTPPPSGVTKTQAIAVLTALVNASTLPD